METFEIHITGSGNIIEELSNLGIKSITVSLLEPSHKVFRVETMSSTIQKFKNLDDCIKWTEGLASMLEAKGVNIIRKKIETQYYPHYINRCQYMEIHFTTTDKQDNFYPLSMNLKSGKVMGTDREYFKDKFEPFFDLWEKNNVHSRTIETIEMCLYDTYVSEDFDWFKLYDC